MLWPALLVLYMSAFSSPHERRQAEPSDAEESIGAETSLGVVNPGIFSGSTSTPLTTSVIDDPPTLVTEKTSTETQPPDADDGTTSIPEPSLSLVLTFHRP